MIAWADQATVISWFRTTSCTALMVSMPTSGALERRLLGTGVIGSWRPATKSDAIPDTISMDGRLATC
jgi:hypothetical protein